MKGAAAGLVVVLTAGAAGAQQVPSPDYFTGLYERVGRTGGAEAGLIDDLVQIVPDPAGGGLLMSVCLPEGAPGAAPLALSFESGGEVPNVLEATDGTSQLLCQHFNDWSNYAILACQTDGGARFTLWAVPDLGSGCP